MQCLHVYYKCYERRLSIGFALVVGFIGLHDDEQVMEGFGILLAVVILLRFLLLFLLLFVSFRSGKKIGNDRVVLRL